MDTIMKLKTSERILLTFILANFNSCKFYHLYSIDVIIII